MKGQILRIYAVAVSLAFAGSAWVAIGMIRDRDEKVRTADAKMESTRSGLTNVLSDVEKLEANLKQSRENNEQLRSLALELQDQMERKAKADELLERMQTAISSSVEAQNNTETTPKSVRSPKDMPPGMVRAGESQPVTVPAR